MTQGHQAANVLDGTWAAVPTPFRDDFALDLGGIAANVRHYRDGLGLTGIFCNGLVGEGWALTLDERKRVLETILDAAAGGLRVGIVVTHHSLSETVALARHAAACGADHLVAARPSGPFTQEELHDHVCAVAEAADMPLVLFDSAAQSGGFSPETILRLAAAGRIVAVKCARGMEEAAALRDLCAGGIIVTDPYEANWLPNLLRFDLGALYADPEPYLFQTADRRPIADYTGLWRAGRVAETCEAARSLEPLRRVYEKWIGGPLRHGVAPNAALKHWCRRMGLAAGPVRRPLRPLPPERTAALDAELSAAFAGR